MLLIVYGSQSLRIFLRIILHHLFNICQVIILNISGRLDLRRIIIKTFSGYFESIRIVF